ncbi:LysR family transcriptional regulator [Paracoccus sp. IB05]|uniref:LysR family transcriptional regulator n=1 Tax=Paracoccus sp. IB05 TaxID=2779367 RepID=UPI0018E7D638|nr:LysR family transcriptional regulator [Paracoccus sp. IB05]MBJ2150322.1 LysR family transcriptional regulator [Paracoccus sp. IB05]
MDSLDDMLLLLEVAEAGSFTRGGQRIGLPKSTASQRIARLEARLGLRLLNRSTRQVTPTSAGEVYLQHCRRVRDEAREAAVVMGHLKTRPEGQLRITCPEITAVHFMPGFLHAFAQANPAISVQLIAINRPLDLLQDRIDFAFRVGAPQGQDMILRRISAIRRVVVAAPEYLETSLPPLCPADLTQHRCLIYDTHPHWTFAGTETPDLRPTVSLSSDSMGFLLRACLQGSGIALLPAYICQSALASGALVQLLPDWLPTPYEMSMIFPSRENPSRAQLAFRDHVDGYDFSTLAGAELGPVSGPFD